MASEVCLPNANRFRDERDEEPQQEPPPVCPPRVIRQPPRGGYDCEFIERPSKGVQCECPVCLLVLREPYQVTCCGCSFCQACVKRVQEDKKCCPTCNEVDFHIFANKGLKRTLNEYRVNCCQREEGCDWVGELGELDRHLNLQPPPEKLLVGCQFSEVDCAYCVHPFQRRYVQAHQSDDCPKRPYACPHCNKYAATFTATYEEVTQNHWPVCPFFPLSCPNNCDLELVLQRQKVEHHMSRDCPLTTVKCDFHMVGCQIELARRDMPSHISENLTGHMSLLQVHMMTHPGENMATYMWLVVGSIQKVVLDNVNVRSQLHKAQETLRQTHAELQQSRDQQQEMHDKLQETHETVAHLEASGISQQEQNESLLRTIDVIQEENKTLHRQKDNLTERLTASEQKIQALDTQLAEINGEKKQLHHKLEECSAELEQHQQNTTLAHRELQEKIQQTSTQLQATVAAHERKQLESEAKLTRVKDDLTRKITASEQKIQSNEATLNWHQKILEEVTCTGTLPFEFKITEFEKHKRASDDCYSLPFYTHTDGYRMCINVNANGYGSGKGTHLSVYCYLMRGDFDDDLQWPFQGAITIQLLNQLEDSNHHTHTIKFAETINPKIISRVTCGDRAESGWGGIHTFLSHTQLDLNTERNCQFLKDDRLKFRVCKATNLDPTACIHRRCLALESFAGAIEPQVCVAPIEFTLSDFEQQKKQNDVWCSPAFYTHPRGYRMCLQVNPNGTGDGLGTHVSINTSIMRSPFDSGLKWPFRGDVTIQIVNHTGEDNHLERVIHYTDQTDDDTAGRVTDGERSDGWGFHEFLPHSSLGYNAARNTQYLLGDSLQIRISKVELKN